MFVVWGKKIVRKKIGFVADFCPICRTIRPFQVMRLEAAGSLYYLGLGEGELVGHERTCQQCDTAYPAEPATYASIAKTILSLSELKRQTYPRIEETLRDQLALEERVRHALVHLSPQERSALIRSPFMLLSSHVEKRFSALHIDKAVAVSMVAALALLTFGTAAARTVAPDSTDVSMLAFLGIGVVLVGWQMALSGTKFMNHQVVPKLARALRPLRPTEHELKSVHAELKELRHKMGKKLVLAELQAQLVQPILGS